mgnify:CR=1 FL=1
MTHEERTNIESYIENINNLVDLKNVLKRCVSRIEGDIEWWMRQLEEQPEDDQLIVDYKPNALMRDYSEIMQGVVEDLLPYWKLINNKK